MFFSGLGGLGVKPPKHPGCLTTVQFGFLKTHKKNASKSSRTPKNPPKSLPDPPQNPPKSDPGRPPNEDRKKVRNGNLWDYRIRGGLASQNRTPAASEGLPKTSKNSLAFNHGFYTILMPSSVPTGPPKSTKIHEKSMPRGTPSWALIFSGFFIDFSLILRSSETLERPSGTTNKGVLRLPRLSVQIDKIIQKTFQKSSFSIPKSSQNRVQDVFKTASESTTISNSLLMRFGRPKCCHVGTMLRPKIPQKSTKIEV